MQATWKYRARSTDWHYYMPIGVTIALARHLPMTDPLIEHERITHCICTEELSMIYKCLLISFLSQQMSFNKLYLHNSYGSFVGCIEVILHISQRNLER